MPEVELHVVRSRLRPLLLQAIEQHIDCGKKGLTLNEYYYRGKIEVLHQVAEELDKLEKECVKNVR